MQFKEKKNYAYHISKKARTTHTKTSTGPVNTPFEVYNAPEEDGLKRAGVSTSVVHPMTGKAATPVWRG